MILCQVSYTTEFSQVGKYDSQKYLICEFLTKNGLFCPFW